MVNKPTVTPREALTHLRGFNPRLPDLTVPELRRTLGVDDIAKLSFNESPYGPSPSVAAALAGAVARVHLYHDAEGKELRDALAARHGVSRDMVFLSNGGDEALTLLAKALVGPGDEVVVPTPTFGAYVFSARLMDAVPVLVPLRRYDLAVDLEAMAAAVTPRTKLVYLCNPNNPTGVLLPGAEVAAFVAGLPPQVAVVLDEAYGEYVDSPGFTPGVSLLAAHPNVAVVRTFSKIYGLAALRLGYGIAHPAVAELVDRVRNPFNVNYLVQEAALAALDDADFTARVAAANAAERDRISTALAGFSFRVYPSQTNFVLADTGADSAALCQELAGQGIIIRPGHGWGLPSCVRISLGDAGQNTRLLAAMERYLADRS